MGTAGGEAGAGSAFERNSVTKEQQLSDALKRSMPGITYISVEDISGGCGAMFEVLSAIVTFSSFIKYFSKCFRVVQLRLENLREVPH